MINCLLKLIATSLAFACDSTGFLCMLEFSSDTRMGTSTSYSRE